MRESDQMLDSALTQGRPIGCCGFPSEKLTVDWQEAVPAILTINDLKGAQSRNLWEGSVWEPPGKTWTDGLPVDDVRRSHDLAKLRTQSDP
jgi:hypothetical protein